MRDWLLTYRAPRGQSAARQFPPMLKTLREVLYGMAIHDQTRALTRQRGNLEHLFVLISFGDLLGLPILPPYYNMRLLPFIVPLVNGWKRRMLREKDVTDALF